MRNHPGAGEDVAPPAGRTRPEPPPEPAPGPPAFAVTVDGVVLRSDGHRLAWVNGVETELEATAPAGSDVERESAPNGRIRIRSPAGGRQVVLRAGQTIDLNGRVRDAYERRSVGVAASGAGGHAPDASSGGVGESTAALADSPDSVTTTPVSEGLVPALVRSMRAVPAPSATSGSDVGTTDSRLPMHKDLSGRRIGM